jgi:hypothetical protein
MAAEPIPIAAPTTAVFLLIFGTGGTIFRIGRTFGAALSSTVFLS